jgi:anti-sigma-K factor RskA
VNVQEIISSGIIESYVLGLASETERAEFEQWCAKYPELAAACRKFEEELEQWASDHAVPPPAGVKVRFLEAVGRPAPGDSSSNQPKIITMANEKSPVRMSGWSRFTAAASIVLLIGFAWFAYQFFSLKGANEDLANQNSSLRAKASASDSILNQIVAEQKMVSDPNVTVVNMVGTQAAPQSSADVYWDSTSSNVFLVVKNMPKLSTDKQYQLWALIDEKPKDLGVFDADDGKVILKMKNTQRAQAFAITIEQKGGSPSPTLQKMQSLGKIIQRQ